MGLKFTAAKATGAALTWGLRNILHRDGATMPGKYALEVDPDLLTHLAPRLREGSVLVVGTNGKTSVTNLLADVLETSGKSVCCNRTGANLSWGVASSLLQTKGSDWGVFETDELWIAQILPHLKSDYVVLLNLFSDQLDRFGEIDRVQESLADTLSASPETVLIYNADDPMCAAIANAAPNRALGFGLSERMPFDQDAGEEFFTLACQQCGGILEYRFRQYSHLGDFACPTCGFARADLAFAARDVDLTEEGVSLTVEHVATGDSWLVKTPQQIAYMAYNLLALSAVTHALDVDPETTQRAVDAYNPQNGRLQRYRVKGHSVLLNLAKNPTGFNQNLNIILRDEGPKAVAFFVNSMEGDGHDASWIWDVTFERLAAAEEAGLKVFAGGMRKNDLQVRLKYAGLNAQLVEGIDEVFAALAEEGAAAYPSVYAIANYTALPPVHAELNAMTAREGKDEDVAQKPAEAAGSKVVAEATDSKPAAEAGEAPNALDVKPFVVAHLFPDLLNLQGCAGNVRALQQRCAWRGIPVEVLRVNDVDVQGVSEADLVFIGDAAGRERVLAEEGLKALEAQLQQAQGAGAVILDAREGFPQLGGRLQTQCQGPLLAFSPEAADYALRLAFDRYAQRTGEAIPALTELDDSVERAASAFMRAK